MNLSSLSLVGVPILPTHSNIGKEGVLPAPRIENYSKVLSRIALGTEQLALLLLLAY